MYTFYIYIYIHTLYYKPFEVQLAHSHAGSRHRRSAHALYSEGLLGELWDAEFKEVCRCHAVGKYPQNFGQAPRIAQDWLGRLEQRMVDSWECCTPQNWLQTSDEWFFVRENGVWIPALRYLSTLLSHIASSQKISRILALSWQWTSMFPDLAGNQRKRTQRNLTWDLQFTVIIIQFVGLVWVGASCRIYIYI